jgi:transposase
LIGTPIDYRKEVSSARDKQRLFIHGARAALPHVAERDTPLGRWAKGLLGRAHQNVAVVALANKLVRIAWAVLRRGQRFDHQLVPLMA